MEHGLDLLHHCRNAACIVEELCRPLACGADIQKVMSPPMHPVKGICINLDTQLMGHGRNMEQGIGGAGDGSMYHNGIFKGLFCYNVADLDSLLYKLHYLFSCLVGHFL